MSKAFAEATKFPEFDKNPVLSGVNIEGAGWVASCYADPMEAVWAESPAVFVLDTRPLQKKVDEFLEEMRRKDRAA